MGSIADTTAVPSPGSNEALALGCRCPVIDNHHGRGFYLFDKPDVTYFYYTEGCPLHTMTTADDA